MRIIAGDYKGRRLYSPLDDDIRPTTDKVKEAIFSIIQEYIDEAICIDLFAGSGNLGLEALSRGAKYCYFCDASRKSLELVKKNIQYCKAENKSEIIAGDYTKTLCKINRKADIIFLDPPYKNGLMQGCFEKIRENDVLSEDGIIIAEHGHYEELPDELFGYEKIKEKKYGSIVISIYS